MRVIKKTFGRKVIEESKIPQHEEEYLLEPVGKYSIMGEFCEMSMIYSEVF